MHASGGGLLPPSSPSPPHQAEGVRISTAYLYMGISAYLCALIPGIRPGDR